MSKIRQALEYERRLTDQQVQAHKELTDHEIQTEERLRSQQIGYERRYTDGQFGQLGLVAEEHRRFHDREHILYEDAIEKASSALNGQLRVLEADFERLRDLSHSYMPIDRFEREHTNLAEKMELALVALGEKLGQEERVTLKQSAQEELLTKLQQSNRWMIGILVTVAIFGATTMLHVLKII